MKKDNQIVSQPRRKSAQPDEKKTNAPKKRLLSVLTKRKSEAVNNDLEKNVATPAAGFTSIKSPSGNVALNEKKISPEHKKFGEKLSFWRRRSGLTQQEAGDKFIELQYFSKNLSGEYSSIASQNASFQNNSADRAWRKFEDGHGFVRLGDAKTKAKKSNSEIDAEDKAANKKLENMVKAVDGDLLLARFLLGRVTPMDEDFADFLTNKRGVGISLDLTMNWEKDEEDNNFIYENAMTLLFKSYFKVNDKYGAVEDFWLAVLQKGSQGIAILNELEKVFGECVRSREDNILYKYAIHLSSVLLANLYKSFYDPFNPASSASAVLEKNRENFYRLDHVVEHLGTEKIFNNWVNKTFQQDIKNQILSFMSPEDHYIEPAKDINKIDFSDKYVDPVFKKLYELDKHIFLDNVEGIKEYEVRSKGNIVKIVLAGQKSIIPVGDMERHVLIRIYQFYTPLTFLQLIWKMQDTIELYERVFDKYPQKIISKYQVEIEGIAVERFLKIVSEDPNF